MRFMMIVKASEASEAGEMPGEELIAAMGRYNEELQKAGVLVDLSGLQPSSKAARVKFSGGKRTVIDGPFAETKELIAGFWIIKAGSLKEAIEWAKRAPAPHGEGAESEIEVRQFFELDDFAPGEAIDRARIGKGTHEQEELAESPMSGVRVAVGTRKGAFILTADGKRDRWNVSGPHFAGWEIYHVKGSPADPNRLYASQSSSWFGQLIQRSNDGGATWEPVGNKFVYDGVPGTHQWYDGTPHPWEFKRVWHLEPSLNDPDTVLAGVEDAALFSSSDGGQNWQEVAGLRRHGSGPHWQPGAGGMCLHTILLDPSDPNRIFIAISAAGAFRTEDGGQTWQPVNKGLHSQFMPDPEAEVGHCVHRIAMHRSRPNVLFMQKHWDVMRSDNAGESWHEVSGNLPTDFGFPIDVHAHEPETIYVVPIKSDSEHFPPEGKLRVYRSRTGGNEWEPLTRGLPQSDCYVNVLRDAMAVDSLDSCGIYFGTTGGQVYCSPDAGDSWTPIVRDLPAVLSVEVQTLA